MLNIKKGLKHLNSRKFRGSVTYLDLLMIISIIFFSFFLRFYNASGLSGGDDSQIGSLTTFTLAEPIKLLYPSFPDEPIVWSGLHYARPVTATVYGLSTVIFGHNRYATIFPPALFCTLSAILLYFILKDQFNRTLSIIATTLFLFSPFLLFFSRIGLLHSQIIFLSLLAYFLIFRYLKTKKPHYIYLSALCWLLNAWTTDIRGLVTAFAILPILYNELYIKSSVMKRSKKKKSYLLTSSQKRFLKHLIIAHIIAGFIYIIYLLIPYILFGNTKYIETLVNFTYHALGIEHTGSLYNDFWTTFSRTSSYIFLTPFAVFIVVPMTAGIIMSFRRIKDFRYMFWIFYMLPIIAYYMQGQIIPERQVIFLPAMVFFSALSLYDAMSSYLDRRTIRLFPLVISFTFLSYIIIFSLFPVIFPAEWSSMTSMFTALGVMDLIEILLRYSYLLVIIPLLVYFFLLIIRKDRLLAQRASIFFVSLILLLNIGFSIIAVAIPLGMYQRTTTVSDIGIYLRNNLDDEKYSCAAGIHSKTFTYYAKRPCVHYKFVDLDWIRDQVEKGELKYFVFNLYHRTGTAGIGKFYSNGTPDFSSEMPGWEDTYREQPSYWTDESFAKYRWIMLNTRDITDQTALDPNNPYWRLREVETSETK